MPWNEAEYQKHNKYLTHFCPHTRQPDGGNGVQCDTYSKCSTCGWNPRVAAVRKGRIRAERKAKQEPKQEPEKWLLGSGAFE